MSDPPGPIELDPAVERFGGGAVLLEPRAARFVRLSPDGVAALARLATGGPRTPAEAALRRRLVVAGLAHPRPIPPPGPPGALGASVSVLVPVRDRAEALARCLEAVVAAGPPGIEVVVVDDGSVEEARTAAVCAAAGARLIRLASSRGPAGARNAGLAQVERPLVAFLDSDCRPVAGWLERLAAHLEDPEVVAAAPRVRPASAGTGVLARYAAARSPLDLGTRPAEVVPGGRVAYVPSAALLVRREALGTGFDPMLRYGEDVDLVWRLHAAGGRLRYEPAAAVDHDEPASWRALLARRWRYGTSAGPLARRHPGALAPLRLGPWAAAGMTAALAGRPVLAGACAAWPTGWLVTRLVPEPVPRRRAARLAATGWLEAGEATGRAAWMLAWPALLLALGAGRGAVRGRGGGRAAARARARRRAVAALLLGPPLREWWRRRPRLDPARFTAACLADDLAYGAGVWWGAARARTAGPLVPRLSRSSPRRSPGSPR